MVTVDYDAIRHNALFFKKILKQSKLCAVLKNDAYGHGLVDTAKALCGIAPFAAVGSVREAVAVRKYFDEVLVLLPVSENEVGEAVSRDVILSADSMLSLRRIARHRGARVHLKINSGMNRLGFSAEQLPAALQFALSRIRLCGAYTHFYGTDNPSMRSQLEYFLRCRALFDGCGMVFHAANTAAALQGSRFHLDMARVGLGLYGYGAPQLVPAKKVSAKVIAVRRVKAGSHVCYGDFLLQKDADVAIVDFGYANGLCRALAAQAKIKGKTCQVLGKPCMAMTAFDVSGAKVSVGDEAVLLGDGVNNGDSDVSIYELLCNLR